ncbi:MAG: DegV family protein [Bacillota bacterium]
MAYKIFSDSACDLSDDILQANDIPIIPYYVSLDHETYYKERSEISLEKYYEGLAKLEALHQYPKTSLPAVQDFIDAFRATLEAEEDVLCIMISSHFSSSIQSAMTAKEILNEEFPNRTIEIISAGAATGLQGLIVLEAIKLKEKGATLKEVISYITVAKDNGRIHFMVGDLGYLQNGGRLSKAAAISGGVLKIKPLVVLKDGKVSPFDIARSKKKAVTKIIDTTKKYFATTGESMSEYLCATGYTDDVEDSIALANLVKEQLPELDFQFHFRIGATIGSHTGPGTLGLAVLKKSELTTF